MKLVESRRRNEHAGGYGRYWLIDARTRELLTYDRGIDLTEVAAYLEQPPAPTPRIPAMGYARFSSRDEKIERTGRTADLIAALAA